VSKQNFAASMNEYKSTDKGQVRKGWIKDEDGTDLELQTLNRLGLTRIGCGPNLVSCLNAGMTGNCPTSNMLAYGSNTLGTG
jgi:hypothetical protein